jgi:hypothetical protein
MENDQCMEHSILNQLGILIMDMSAVKLPGEAKQNDLPPKCGQPFDTYLRLDSWNVSV